MNKNKTVVGVFQTKSDRQNGRVIKQDSTLVETFEYDKGIKELLSDPHWKPRLIGRCLDLGYKVNSVSVLRQSHQGCDVAVTVVLEQAVKISIGKPVTRGGKQIGPPLTGKRTMASKRRGR